MLILVLNPGSSSLKLSLFDTVRGATPRLMADGEVTGIGQGRGGFTFRDASGADLASSEDGTAAVGTMEEATALVERALDKASMGRPDAVGYRVVHPGPTVKGHQLVTPELLEVLRGAERFAPLHDPAAVELMEEMMRRLPKAQHVACFDTVFHETMPEEATVYALPKEVRAEGVRRYGFHGLSCESVVREMREAAVLPRLLVIAHLGSGASVTACVEGLSVDTTMGLTPTGGVVMGTRPGDLDPGVVLYLLRRDGATVESVEQMLNHASGLKAVGGVNDMRELEERAGKGDAAARMAIGVFCAGVARACAGMLALYGGDDAGSAVVFTGGIGEHDAAARAAIASKLGVLGVAIEDAANVRGLDGTAVRRLSRAGAGTAVYVARADEDGMIARHVLALCS